MSKSEVWTQPLLSRKMISILLWCTLSLISTANTQQHQATVVYEQQPHFVESKQLPQSSYQPQQQQVNQHYAYQHQQPQPQQYAQQYTSSNVGQSVDPFLQHQPIPMFQAMPSMSPDSQHVSSSSNNNGGFMQRIGYSQPPPAPLPAHQIAGSKNSVHHHMNMQGIPMGPHHHEFSARRGPPPSDKRRGRPPKPRYNAKKRVSSNGPPIKMMDMNRIPKPPKYPLYDIGSLSMATPPPPPVMHPMAQMPSNAYATFVKSPRDGRPGPPGPPRGGKPRRGRPPKKQRPGRGGNRRPPPNHISRSNRKPPPFHHDKKHAVAHGFDHPMASNLDPLLDSPSLGRPLSYDEYMERPSHSFTNDPWNFDPFAAKYNSGMNTYAMKYNYDPLGMNSLDKSQSHLDPNKLSYPGDYYTHDISITPGVDSNPHGVKSSQIGGWDQNPESYRSPPKNLQPPPSKLSPPKPKSSHASQSQNSFNVYEDMAEEASAVVQSETVHHPLKLLSDANPGVEFSIESADGSDTGVHGSGSSTNYQQSQYYSDQLHNTDPIYNTPETHWANYPQIQSPYQDSGTAQSEQVSLSHDNVIFDQPRPSPQPYYSTIPQQYNDNNNQQNNYQQPAVSNYPHQTSPSRHDYENSPSPYTYDNDAQMNNRKQDYVHHEAPVSNLSDQYSPGGEGLSVDILPPHENAPIFKRTGKRTTRHEKTPMIELEGLTLFNDILHNKNAIAARNHLFRVL